MPNEADREKDSFADRAIHYFPPGVVGPYRGKKAIADLWINTVHMIGSCRKIDRMVADEKQGIYGFTERMVIWSEIYVGCSTVSDEFVRACKKRQISQP